MADAEHGRHFAANADAALKTSPQYVLALAKIINSHVRNEYVGASTFDVASIAVATNPREKWFACKFAMEEYGHHLRFARLASDLHLPDPWVRPSLSTFEYKIDSWADYILTKAIVDQAEVVLMEDLRSCSYLPLRRLVERLMPEEHVHVKFGQQSVRALLEAGFDQLELEQGIQSLVLATIPFFGRSDSPNNEIFRKWEIKTQTNDQSRAAFLSRTRHFIEAGVGLRFPDVSSSWSGE
jgi:ring-1,2-phenylacetyl-CoA epoxidase subunit PaaA